jgi:hypothetical protein
MGANAVTSIPVYADGEVLEASRLNVTNSGIPVFADGTARDAAFGGTGEKTLAEGQYCYLENANTLQVYNGSVWVTLKPDGAKVITDQSTTSTSFTDLATVGPSVTIDTGTSAIVTMSTFAYNSLGAGNTAMIGVAVSGATTIAANTEYARTTFWSANASVYMGGTFLVTGLTAGSNTFTIKYKTDGSTIFFGNRYMTVTPIP